MKILIVFMDFPGLLSRFQFSFLMLDPFDLTKKGGCDLGTSQAVAGFSRVAGSARRVLTLEVA